LWPRTLGVRGAILFGFEVWIGGGFSLPISLSLCLSVSLSLSLPPSLGMSFKGLRVAHPAVSVRGHATPHQVWGLDLGGLRGCYMKKDFQFRNRLAMKFTTQTLI
jgi:hypothetical protein